MSHPLKNCWEIMKCGREAGGHKIEEFGICPAYPDSGHSCWMEVGTFCGGAVQGTFAAKERRCVLCEVHTEYNPVTGPHKREFRMSEPQEYDRMMKKYAHLLRTEVSGRQCQ